MSGVTTVTVRPEDGSGRLDRWFKRHYPGLGHGRLEKLLRTGQIRVDGKRARAGDPVAPGQSIRVPPLPETPASRCRCRRSRRAPGRRMSRCCAMPCCIATTGRWSSTSPPVSRCRAAPTPSAMSMRCSTGCASKSAERPRLVHRLDKDTSGVLLIARHAAAAAFFTRAFREKTTRKIYWADRRRPAAAGAGPHRSRAFQGRRCQGGGGRERVHADDEAARAPSPITA